MAQNIPKFGDWEGEENYTDTFAKARKGRSGEKISTTKDSQRGSDVLSNDAAPVIARSIGKGIEPVESMVLKPKHEGRSSRDDEDRRQLSHENLGRKANTDLSHQQHGDIGLSYGDKRTTRTGGVEQSPLHPHYQAKVGGRGGGSASNSARSSPSREKKPSQGSHGLAPSTPGRSRLRSVTHGDESPEKGPAVPKFGDWDENDPTSADGFTHIFNKVREEKQGGAGTVPDLRNDSSNSNAQKRAHSDDSTMCCCFSWCKK